MTEPVFSSPIIAFGYLKLVKKTCVKESKHLFLFLQYVGKCYSCVKIKASDYCDGVSEKLKYLNSYDYILEAVILHVVKACLFYTKTVKPLKKQG